MNSFKKISRNGLFLVKEFNGDIIPAVAESIKSLTKSITQYPFILAMKKNGRLILCLRSAAEPQGSTDAFVGAAIAAYSPEEVIISFSVNFGAFKGSKPPQACFIRATQSDAPEMWIFNLLNKSSFWEIGEALGIIQDTSEINYSCKDALIELAFCASGERAGEAKAALMTWMPDILWNFNAIDNGADLKTYP